jgi:hypothetical protein
VGTSRTQLCKKVTIEHNTSHRSLGGGKEMIVMPTFLWGV